jgi:hypothetical protein
MRDRVVRFRASTEETSKIEALANGRGLSISELMRRAVFGVRMPSRKFNAEDIALLTRLIAELGRIGGNLNQMVRRANSGKLVGHDNELSDALLGVNQLRSLLREIIR